MFLMEFALNSDGTLTISIRNGDVNTMLSLPSPAIDYRFWTCKMASAYSEAESFKILPIGWGRKVNCHAGKDLHQSMTTSDRTILVLLSSSVLAEDKPSP
jgi:hypothetical protein